MSRKSVKILTGRGSFYATSKFARSLLDDDLARVESASPFIIQLTGPERVSTAYAPPGPFADELREFIERLYKLGKRTHQFAIPNICGLCRHPHRQIVKGTRFCGECQNEVVLLEKLVLGEVKSIEDLTKEGNK